MPVDQQRSQLLFQRLNRVVNKLASRPLPENVHQFRTTVRRLETLFDALIAEPDRNQRKLLRRLARLRRRAGKVRDLDVQIAALRGLKIGGDASRKAQLMRVLSEERSRREKKLVGAFDPDTLRDIRKRLSRAAGQLPFVPAANGIVDAGDRQLSSTFDPIAVALRRFAEVSREQGPLNEGSLHDYRMQCKRIRYVAEMAGDDAQAKPVIDRLKAMQDAIGGWHDWDALTRRAEDLFDGNEPPPLVSALRNVTHAKLTDALRAAGEAKRDLLDLARECASAARKPSGSASARGRAATAIA